MTETPKITTVHCRMFQWIPVSEKLPIPHTTCLVTTCNPQNKEQRRVSIATYFGDDTREWAGHKNVTHWAPLPKPAEVE